MSNKSVIAASAITIVVLLAVGGAQMAMANPIPWPYTPNQDKPTLTIQSPQNNTVYAFNSTDIWLNFTITVPDAWKTGPMPPPYVGQVTSLKAYMDGSPVGQNRELWVGPELRLDGSKSFAVKLDESTSGLHTLNVTVVSETYYTGPAVNGSHIPHYLDEGGTVYEYPAATSDIRYFTVEQSTQSIQDINIQPLAQSDSALPSWVIPLTVIGAIAIAAAAMLLMRKKTHV